MANSKCCQICAAPDHTYSGCPQPLINPRAPQKVNESLEKYHWRLRYNEHMRLWTAKKMEDPEYKAERNAHERARYKKSDNSTARVRGRIRVERQRLWIASLKTGPCMDCGNCFPPECMDFDHRPGEEKLDGIGRLMNGPKDRTLAEMQKCDLVCANCHRIRTRQRALQKLKPRKADCYTSEGRARQAPILQSESAANLPLPTS